MMHLGTSIRSRFCRSFIHVSHSSNLSAGRGSFHPMFPWHIVCSILFPVKVKGERNPNGSNIDATMESILSRVGDVLWPTTLKQNTSSSTFHLIPSACAIGNRSFQRSRSLTSPALSDSATEFITFLLLETNLCRRSLPLAHID